MSLLVIDVAASTANADPTLEQVFDQLTQLEGREYLLRLIWSPRETIYYLNMYDQNENELALGICLVINTPLLRRFSFNPVIPPGDLRCVDFSDTNTDIQVPSDLGQRVLLVYRTSDDTDI